MLKRLLLLSLLMSLLPIATLKAQVKRETGWRLVSTSNEVDTFSLRSLESDGPVNASMIVFRLDRSASGPAILARFTMERGNTLVRLDDEFPIYPGEVISTGGIQGIYAFSFDKTAAGDSLWYYASSDREAMTNITSPIDIDVSLDSADVFVDMAALEASADAIESDVASMENYLVNIYPAAFFIAWGSNLTNIATYTNSANAFLSAIKDTLVVQTGLMRRTQTTWTSGISAWNSSDGNPKTSATAICVDGWDAMLVEISWTVMDGCFKLKNIFSTSSSADTAVTSYVSDIGVTPAGVAVWGCIDTMTVDSVGVGAAINKCTVRVPLMGKGVGYYYPHIDPWDDTMVRGMTVKVRKAK